MFSEHSRLCAFIIQSSLIALISLTARPASAEFLELEKKRCIDATNTFEDRIKACTSVIEAERHVFAQGGPTDRGLSIALNARGFAFADHKRFDNAIADYDEAIRFEEKLQNDMEQMRLDFQPFALPYVNRCWARFSKNDLDGAKLDCDKAINFESDFADAYAIRGLIFEQKGDRVRANSEFRTVLQFNDADTNWARSIALQHLTSDSTEGSNAGPASKTRHSLAQTAAFILSGGFVDLGDITQIDNETVRVPSHMIGLTYLVSETRYRVVNQAECIISTEIPSLPQRSMTLYLSNVILNEARAEETMSNQMLRLSKLYLRGEDHVVCVNNGGNRQCLRQFDTATPTENLPRMWNALNYLYSNFCSPAKRKSAF
jgi:tetratricopeptide (TPR) repeat protein